MEDIIAWIIIGIIGAGILTFIIYNIIKFIKMKPEQKKEILKTYLKGLVVLAEQEIVGTKRGAERLKMVEDWFNKKAPMIYKIILLLVGKNNLKEFIEEALKEIKDAFNK